MKALTLQKLEPEDTAPLYRQVRGSTRLLATVLLGLAFHLLAAPPALAYTGGPIQAHIGGLEPGEQRVYYCLVEHGGDAREPQVWFFDLDGDIPEKPERARYLEDQDRAYRSAEEGISDEWQALLPKLKPLAPLSEFDLGISLRMEDAGRDSLWMTPGSRGHVVLEAGDIGQTADITLHFESMMQVRGPYGIPGRTEALVVIVYRGRAYGWEELEQPVLLTTGGNRDSEVRLMRQEVQPAAWNVRGDGRFGGQFLARFGEVGSSEEPALWYLFRDYFAEELPRTWVVGLENTPPMQPVRYGGPEADSLLGAWDTYTRITRLGGRRTELRSIDEFGVTLRFEADSVGVDPTLGVPRYEGRLVANTANGAGALDLTMYRSPLIRVRGVYPLPDRSELVLFVSYTGEASGREFKDLPLVIYPR